MRIARHILGVVSVVLLTLSATTALQGQTIHLITAADFRSFRGSALTSVKNDITHITEFFKRNTPSRGLKVYNVDGDMATPEAICEAIEKVRPAENDVVTFYYSGHAANAAEQGGQYFQLKDKKGNAAALARSKVRNLLCDKRTRLVVILTDCCNVYQPQELDKDVSHRPYVKSPADFTPIIKQLFIKQSGVVNITSSKFGQLSYTGQGGSIATDAWISTFEDKNSLLKNGTQQEITWRSVMNDFTLSSDKLFKKRYPKGAPPSNQKTQVPHAYELPGLPRLGVGCVTMGNGNVLVTEIQEDSPGAKAGFKKGDLITHINGEEILDEPAYSRAIDISSSVATIKYKRGSKEMSTEVELRGLPQKPQVEPTASTTTRRGQATEDPAFQAETANQSQNRNRTRNESASTEQARTSSGPVFGASVQGNKIVKVVENSPAASVGLAVGDLLIKFNDTVIKSAEDFGKAVDASPADATLIIQKKGSEEQTTVSVVLNKSENQESQGSETTSVASDNSQDTPVFGASVQGNKIVKIIAKSPAAVAGLSIGDLILKFNDKEIKKAEDFAEAVDASDSTAFLLIQDRTGQKKNIYVNLAK